MNKQALLHIPDSSLCFATGKNEVTIRLRAAEEDRGLKAFLVYGPKYEYQIRQYEVQMQPEYRDGVFQYFEKKLTLSDVRLAYVFRIEEDGKSYFFSEDGLTDGYSFTESFYNFFQIPYINENDRVKTVDWMRNAVFYQIFVDRFYHGDHEKDTSYINMNWGERPTPKSFAGGDIRGMIEKLDYIKGLGVNAIYLTPVFKSVSNHKYDISDYKQIDPMFGSEKDLKELVEKAHRIGIRVVLDAVFNHCSMYLSQFQDVMKKGRESEYYDWFIIDGDRPDPAQINYECFAACNYMPKLNTAVPAVQDFLIDVGTYWIREADIDGWRLDVSDEVSHDFWRMFRRAVKEEKSDAVIIGESWHDASDYLRGDQFDSIMNYAFTKACLDYFAHDRFDEKQMSDKLNGILMRNMTPVNDMMLNLLDSHDTHRFFTEVDRDKKKLLTALALEAFFPGAMCIYYGTEICLEGGYDPDSRRCFNWDEDFWDFEFMSHMKKILALKEDRAIQYGETRIYTENGALVVERSIPEEKITLKIKDKDSFSIYKEAKNEEENSVVNTGMHNARYSYGVQ